MTLLQFATDIVDQAARTVDPAEQADLFWSILVVAAAGIVTVQGDVEASEKLYRLADGFAGRLTEDAS